MSLQRLIIDAPESADQFKSICDLSPDKHQGAINLGNYIDSLPAGVRSANIKAQVGAVQATATITSTGTAGNDETMKLANQTLTAKTSSADPEAGEFDISATPATQAANIALAINSMPELAGIVTAEANAGVVTVTSVVPGLVGNGLECADVDLANVTVSGFSSGSDGTSYELDLE